MGFFGEFLIEKKLITKEFLLEALIEQMHRTPQTYDIVVQLNLMSVDDILKVIEFQVVYAKDFKTAAEKAGIWSAEIDTAIVDTIRYSRVPVGQILVELGRVTFPDMTRALDEYIERRARDDKNVPASKNTERALAQDANFVDLRSLSKAPSISPILLKNYQELFSEERLSRLEGLLSELITPRDKKNGQVRPLLEKISVELHELKEIVRFIKASISTALLLELISMVEFFLGAGKTVAPERCSNLVNLGNRTIGFLLMLRSSLVKQASEGPVWESSRERLLELEKDLKSHLQN